MMVRSSKISQINIGGLKLILTSIVGLMKNIMKEKKNKRDFDAFMSTKINSHFYHQVFKSKKKKRGGVGSIQEVIESLKK